MTAWAGRFLRGLGRGLLGLVLDVIQGSLVLVLLVAATLLWPRQPVVAWFLLAILGVLVLLGVLEWRHRRRRGAAGAAPGGGRAGSSRGPRKAWRKT